MFFYSLFFLFLVFIFYRLYARAVFQGFRRSKVNQYENQARLRVEGLNAREDTKFYLGKRVVHVYKTAKGYKVSSLLIF